MSFEGLMLPGLVFSIPESLRRKCDMLADCHMWKGSKVRMLFLCSVLLCTSFALWFF